MRCVSFIVLIVCLLCVVSAAIAEDQQTVSPSSLLGDTNISGTITDIDYSIGSFILVDGTDANTILAGDARVRFNAGKFGQLSDLRNKAYVTVSGDRISAKSIKARSIVVIDETGNLKDLRTQGNNPSADLNINGQIVRVNPAAGEFVIKAGTDTFVIVVGRVTEIKRSTFVSNLYDMSEGDQVNVVGNRQGVDRINAITVIINSAKSNVPVYDDRYYGRYDLVQGTIITPSSTYSRSIVVQTSYSGLQTIEVPRGIDVIRSGRSVSIHDLIRGEWVRAYGTWDTGRLEAVSVESYGISYRPDSDHHDGDNHHNPGTDLSNNSQTRVGTITSVNSKKLELTVDIGLSDMTINASDAKVQRNGSSISFSSLEKGDKVQLKGTYSAGFLKASLISLLAKAIDNKDKVKN